MQEGTVGRSDAEDDRVKATTGTEGADGLSAAARAANVLHYADCDPGIAWSSGNASEALPGVVTPLTWSLFGDPIERAFKATFNDMGVLERERVTADERPETRLMALFYGRAAGNVETFRMLADRTPGNGGNAVEEQIFGRVRPGMEDRPVRSRYPVVAFRMPVAALRLPGRLRSVVEDVEPWWRAAVAGPSPSPSAARALVAEGARRFEEVMRPHTLAAILCQALYDQIRKLAVRAGREGLELDIITGYGEMAETRVVTDLWDVSRERLDLDEFVRRHGFHGPDEGELSSASWRMDRAPLERLLVGYRGMDEDRDPRRVEAGQARRRVEAERELLAALPRAHRGPARAILALGARIIPLRGVGKAAFLRCADAVRFGTRALGADLVERGLLPDVDAAFLLTMDELLAATPPADLAATVAERRAIREEYLRYELPEAWEGVPSPVPVGGREPVDADRTTVSGIAVTSGTVEAVARVVTRPDEEDDFEPGDVLVCRTTDPSWASIMMLASALVIDIGGPISHGAIVARELGVPCVIGTKDGTTVIGDGDLVRVDGAAGTVEVVRRAAAAQEA
ncbi:MAG: PEP-utilizing enzyme [Solirubrobacteraceae bacterium]|nr:PEP-utilizing enzyme [Solirubrobacteraceae bacterium]